MCTCIGACPALRFTGTRVHVYVSVGLSYVTPYVPKRGWQSKALEDPSLECVRNLDVERTIARTTNRSRHDISRKRTMDKNVRLISWNRRNFGEQILSNKT